MFCWLHVDAVTQGDDTVTVRVSSRLEDHLACEFKSGKAAVIVIQQEIPVHCLMCRSFYNSYAITDLPRRWWHCRVTFSDVA